MRHGPIFIEGHLWGWYDLPQLSREWVCIETYEGTTYTRLEAPSLRDVYVELHVLGGIA